MSALLKITKRSSFEEFDLPEFQLGWEGKVLVAILSIVPLPAVRTFSCGMCRRPFHRALIVRWWRWVFVFHPIQPAAGGVECRRCGFRAEIVEPRT